MKFARAIRVLVGLTLGVGSIPSLTAAGAADPCRLPGGVLKSGALAARSMDAADGLAGGRAARRL